MKKVFKIIRIGDYKDEQIFYGSKNEAKEFLQQEALTMRKKSRSTMNESVKNTVFKILDEDEKHQSELVNMASFELGNFSVKKLLPLMNAHGIFKYQFIEVTLEEQIHQTLEEVIKANEKLEALLMERYLKDSDNEKNPMLWENNTAVFMEMSANSAQTVYYVNQFKTK